MTDEVREKYLKMVNIICEQFGLNKPNQIIYVCEAVENLIEPYMKENEELKTQIEKMKCCSNCKCDYLHDDECYGCRIGNSYINWELAD